MQGCNNSSLWCLNDDSGFRKCRLYADYPNMIHTKPYDCVLSILVFKSYFCFTSFFYKETKVRGNLKYKLKNIE